MTTGKILNAAVTVSKIFMLDDVMLGKSEEYLCIRIVFEDCSEPDEKVIAIPFQELNSNAFYKKLEKEGVIFSESSSERKAFRNDILSQRRKVMEKIHHIMMCPQGFFDFAGRHFCRLGTDILAEKDMKGDDIEEIENMLNVKSPVLRKSIAGAYKKALKFAFVDKMVSPMLMLYFGFSVWSDFIEKAGYSQRYVLYVEGETGTMKSSLCREVVKVFDEKTEISLSSTYAALQNFFQKYRVVPVLLDDYNESDFSKIKREKGEKLVEFIQMYAERQGLCKTPHGKEICLLIHSGLIVTAEKVLQNPSTMNRCLVVTPVEVDTELLTEIQRSNRDNGIFADLLRCMVQYTLANYNGILEEIPKIYDRVSRRCEEFGEFSKVPGYLRVMESYKVSLVVLELWWEFLKYKRIDKNEAGCIVNTMEEALKSSVEHTLSNMYFDDGSIEIINAVYESISKARYKGRFADSIPELKKKVTKYIGVKDGDKICIRGEELEAMVSARLRAEISKNKIGEALYKHGLVTKYHGRYSSIIPSSGITQRYYCIDYKRLFQIVNPEMSDIFR